MARPTAGRQLATPSRTPGRRVRLHAPPPRAHHVLEVGARRYRRIVDEGQVVEEPRLATGLGLVEAEGQHRSGEEPDRTTIRPASSGSSGKSRGPIPSGPSETSAPIHPPGRTSVRPPEASVGPGRHLDLGIAELLESSASSSADPTIAPSVASPTRRSSTPRRTNGHARRRFGAGGGTRRRRRQRRPERWPGRRWRRAVAAGPSPVHRLRAGRSRSRRVERFLEDQLLLLGVDGLASRWRGCPTRSG